MLDFVEGRANTSFSGAPGGGAPANAAAQSVISLFTSLSTASHRQVASEFAVADDGRSGHHLAGRVEARTSGDERGRRPRPKVNAVPAGQPGQQLGHPGRPHPRCGGAFPGACYGVGKGGGKHSPWGKRAACETFSPPTGPPCPGGLKAMAYCAAQLERSDGAAEAFVAVASVMGMATSRPGTRLRRIMAAIPCSTCISLVVSDELFAGSILNGRSAADGTE